MLDWTRRREAEQAGRKGLSMLLTEAAGGTLEAADSAIESSSSATNSGELEIVLSFRGLLDIVCLNYVFTIGYGC